MRVFLVYARRVYGPLGRFQEFKIKLIVVDSVDAEDPVEALRIARERGNVAPIVGEAS